MNATCGYRKKEQILEWELPLPTRSRPIEKDMRRFTGKFARVQRPKDSICIALKHSKSDTRHRPQEVSNVLESDMDSRPYYGLVETEMGDSGRISDTVGLQHFRL